MTDSRTRGLSDVVSFTLVFSIIIFMIGVVTVTGVSTLGDVQQGTEANVAGETMRNYANTLADHRTQSAPRRSTTIKLQGHQLERVDSQLGLRVDGGAPSYVDTNALVRTTDTDTGTEFVYESGALFRVQNGGSVVVRQPPMRCGSRTAHIPLLVVLGEFSFSSGGRVTLESHLESQRLNATRANSVTVLIDQTARPAAWADALAGQWTRLPARDGFRCSPIDRVVVHRTVVTIQLVT